MMSHFLSSSGN